MKKLTNFEKQCIVLVFFNDNEFIHENYPNNAIDFIMDKYNLTLKQADTMCVKCSRLLKSIDKMKA
ncbi:MAG: hypothetical protein PHT02_00005 [Tissierellia bacterium]|nr:hypothetical protein [Tissierellia bacterium]